MSIIITEAAGILVLLKMLRFSFDSSNTALYFVVLMSDYTGKRYFAVETHDWDM